jgi:hypothetical protein
MQLKSKTMKIYSIHYNKPEYIELQKKSFDKWVKFDYEFIVVNNAIDINLINLISTTSQDLGLRTINCNNNISGMSSVSHQNSFKYIIDDVQDGDNVMIVDHDLFVMNEVDESYYNKHDMVILPQLRGNIEYPWPGLIIFNNIKRKCEISFDSVTIENESCDTGGKMYYYIKDNNLNIKKVNESYFDDGSMLMSNLDNIFIHLISGSGWNSAYDLENKLIFLKEKIKI